MKVRYSMPVRGTLRVASLEPLMMGGGFSFHFEADASTGYVNKLTMEIAAVPREHWPTITCIGQDEHAKTPRWPFETNKAALRLSTYEPYLINLESYLSVFGLQAIEFHRLSEEWLPDLNDELVSMEQRISLRERLIDPVCDPLSPMTLARCIAASNAPEADTLTIANFRVGQMYFQNGLYVEAIRHLYFCLEHEFAGGQVKRKATVAAFCASQELCAIVKQLFFVNKHLQFELLRTKYDCLKDATEPQAFYDFLFALRGSIQHANRYRPGKWHPSRQHHFEDEAICIMNVAEEVVFRKVTERIKSAPVRKRGDEANKS